MVKEFNNLEEMQKYYDKSSNTYIFKENDEYFDICINFNLDIKANIKAWDIKAFNINALDIKAVHIRALFVNVLDIDAKDINASDINAKNIDAKDIKALNIKADNISFNAVCIAYNNIICKKCEGRRNNAVISTLDGKLIIKE